MIQINDLSFGYSARSQLFDNLSLNLEPGNIYGLLGKNGAGKTTLIKQMAGLLFPDKGSLSVMGYSPEKRAPEMLKDIFVIPEEFYLPSVSAKQFIEINGAFYPGFDQEQLNRYLKELEIEGHTMINHMSFGQKKKLIIAFSLAVNTKILMLDEPTNGLDIPSKSQFRKIISQSMNDDRLILISTHQVRDLSNLINYVIILEGGKIIFEKDIFSIAEKIAFKRIKSMDEEEVLYKEETLGGYNAMVKNKDGVESEIDLELLFNGIISNLPFIKEKIE